MLQCEADGNWSSEAPSCIPVVCGAPSIPPHTKTHFIAAEHGMNYGYGSTVTYSCADGYELQGRELKGVSLTS